MVIDSDAGIKRKIMETIVCQQCNGLLSFENDDLCCKTCNLNFPISKGLIFMGYDELRKEEIKKVVISEKEHQTSLEGFQKHYTFAYPSFKLGLMSINILSHDIDIKNPIATDIGSGGSPMGKIPSDYGFNTYRCELDPNSLFSGLIWDQNLTLGKNIVCDSSILPFPSNSIDVVYCKEFVHHIKDYYSFFLEMNRVLKKKGIFLMIEPTTRVGSFLKKDYHHGHYRHTIFSYYTALLRAGFIPYRYYIYFYGLSKKLKWLDYVLGLYFNNQLMSNSSISTSNGIILKMCFQRIFGGSSVLFLKKNKNLTNFKERPIIQVIDPNWLKLDKRYLNDPKLQKLKEILNEVTTDLKTMKNIRKLSK